MKHLLMISILASLVTASYSAGHGLGPDDIGAVMDYYQALGIENILVVPGGLPPGARGF